MFGGGTVAVSAPHPSEKQNEMTCERLARRDLMAAT